MDCSEMHARIAYGQSSAISNAENSEGGDREHELFKSTILYLARLDEWIMNVRKSPLSKDAHIGKRQKA